MEEHPKNRNRCFIHDHELEIEFQKKMEARMDQIQEEKKNSHINNQRLNIAKELLIALMGNKDLYPNGATLSDMIDDSIKVTDLFLERIEK